MRTAPRSHRPPGSLGTAERESSTVGEPTALRRRFRGEAGGESPSSDWPPPHGPSPPPSGTIQGSVAGPGALVAFWPSNRSNERTQWHME